MLLLFFTFFCFEKCYALTLNEAVEIGIIKNPSIQVEKAKLNISDAEIKQANLMLNPKIFFEASVAAKSYIAGLEQTFELGGKRRQRVNTAKIDKEITIQNLTLSIIQLRSDIRKAYIRFYNAKLLYDAAEDIMDVTSEFEKIAIKRQSAGDIALLDVIQAEISYVKAKTDFQQAKLELLQAFNNFNSILGGGYDFDIQLEKPDITLCIEDLRQEHILDNKEFMQNLISQAFKNRPEIGLIEKNIERTKSLQRLAKLDRIPNATIQVGPDFEQEHSDNGGLITKSNVFVNLTLDIPVFNRGQGAYAVAKAQELQYEKQLVDLQNTISTDVQNACAAIVQNRQTVLIYQKELLPKAKDVLNKSKRSFEEGKSNILTSLSAESAYIGANTGYINALEAYQQSLNDLERAIGGINGNL